MSRVCDERRFRIVDRAVSVARRHGRTRAAHASEQCRTEAKEIQTPISSTPERFAHLVLVTVGADHIPIPLVENQNRVPLLIIQVAPTDNCQSSEPIQMTR